MRVRAGTLVMVRAARDEPIAFVAIAAGRGVVQVAAENREKRASRGFPRRRVFARDEGLLRELLDRYREGRPDLVSALWARANPPDLAGLPARDAATAARTHP